MAFVTVQGAFLVVLYFVLVILKNAAIINVKWSTVHTPMWIQVRGYLIGNENQYIVSLGVPVMNNKIYNSMH